jgi:hypothetical protein
MANASHDGDQNVTRGLAGFFAEQQFNQLAGRCKLTATETTAGAACRRAAEVFELEPIGSLVFVAVSAFLVLRLSTLVGIAPSGLVTKVASARHATGTLIAPLLAAQEATHAALSGSQNIANKRGVCV